VRGARARQQPHHNPNTFLQSIHHTLPSRRGVPVSNQYNYVVARAALLFFKSAGKGSRGLKKEWDFIPALIRLSGAQARTACTCGVALVATGRLRQPT